MTLKKTFLFEQHQALGAKMAPFAGFEMPIQYSSVKEEALAVRNSSGVFDVSHMGEFFVEGTDAVKFVDYLVPNDFTGAEVQKAVYSPLCNEQGKMLDDLIAYKLSETKVLICVNASNIEKDWNWISSKTEGFDCQLSNQSDDFSLLALQGPDSEKILLELGLSDTAKMDYYSAIESAHEGTDLILARTGYTGEDGFEIFGPHQKIASLWDQMLAKGTKPCGLAARDVLRLEVCYPLYGHELTEELTPLDTGLKWTLKLANESNFIGKEALKGHQATHRLIKLSLERGIPRDGYPILNDKEEQIGIVTSGTMSVATGKGICLGLVKKDLFPENKSFVVSIRNKPYKATYHTKAFITGGHK